MPFHGVVKMVSDEVGALGEQAPMAWSYPGK